jgi:hypothetical protein
MAIVFRVVEAKNAVAMISKTRSDDCGQHFVSIKPAREREREGERKIMKSKEVTVVFRTYGRVTNGVVDTIRFLFLFLSEFLFCFVW